MQGQKLRTLNPGASEAWTALLRVAGEAKAQVVGEEQISLYLNRFPDAATLAGDILRAARIEFGAEAEILIERYRDPEIEDEYLSVCVRLAKYDNGVRERLGSISDAFGDRLCTISGYISVSTDFRPPTANAL